MRHFQANYMEHIGRGGLAQLRVAELLQPGFFDDILAEKLSGLDTANLTQQQVETQVRMLRDLMRATIAGQYNQLSALAFARILVVLDHFVRVRDHTPDTQWKGYEDDLAMIQAVLRDFSKEFDEFREWRQRNQG